MDKNVQLAFFVLMIKILFWLEIQHELRTLTLSKNSNINNISIKSIHLLS